MTPYQSSQKPKKRRSYSPLVVKPTSSKRLKSKKMSGSKARALQHRKQGMRPSLMQEKEKDEQKIPTISPKTIRVIPLGGVEEIGRNMTLIEYENDIVVVDCGFQFKEEDTPGIDYILPNTKYLEERRSKIRAIIITHGHLDHIGGIPYIMEYLNNPPIYSRRLTTVMIKKRQEEFPHLPALNIREVEKNDTIKLGENFVLKFFSVTHTIPDSMGVIIETPLGSVVHTGDLKLDHRNGIPVEAEEKEFAKFKKENVLLLMADSTNVERPGFSIPEQTVFENIEEIIKNAKGRLIIGTFASQLERIVKIIEIAERYKKKVVIEGRSMKTNVEIVKELGILKPKQGTFINAKEMPGYPSGRILVLATGAQGDEYAALMRTANKTHKQLKIQKNDTIVLSSSIIPGNERAVQKLKDNLSRQGAHIIHYQVSDVHSSGHANADETAWIHKKIRPKFFIPLHGYHYMLRVHADLAQSLGVPRENIIIPDNGSVIEIQNSGKDIVKLKEQASTSLRMVDGFSIGDIQEVVIRDRKMLAQDGMFVIIATINLKTGKLRKSPDIISRGFVYLRESQPLLQETRLLIKKSVEDITVGMNPINFDYVKTHVTDDISRFLFQKTNKRPIVIPVLLGI
jgi:ribonuclease J